MPRPAAAPPTGPTAKDVPGRERRYDVDLLRVVCTAAVVLVHAAAEFTDAGHRTTGILGDSAGRFAVPVFFAMAGWAALVGSPVRGDAQLLTRLGRVLRPMAVWTVLYLLWQYAAGPSFEDGAAREAGNALSGSVEAAFHLWYLYIYVPLLLLLGVAVLVVQRRPAPRRSLILLAAFAVAPAAAGDLKTLTGLPLPAWNWSVSLYALGYALAGAALLAARRPGPRGLWIAGVAAGLVALTVYQFTVRHPAAYGSAAVAAVTFAVVGATAGVRVPERARAVLRRLSDASFGTYLVHLLLVMLLVRPAAQHVSHGIAAPLALAVTAAGAVVLSFAASVLWGRLGMRRWLG
ncbi:MULTISPECIES: acyltransferase family protein [Streptomyces]|uniref:Acyltransferase family protein n=1 Tax=Streptomyces edwardsiae TaxID=3075527 RepID=A0ABU2Q584_9ACTN|nr:acyltransferase family protein [Streptomyces sp. DSM 41636]MDT0399597.1 acyltransferase family protein [Streptomyces sp. DSM 41636]